MSVQPNAGTVVLAVCFGVLGTLGILTNSVLVLYYVRRPIMRTSTNVFLVHKALADLLSLLPVPLRVLEILSGQEARWSSSGWLCKAVVTTETLCMIVSANVLFALAYDRLTAVTRPGDGLRRTVATARNHVAAAWVYSLLLVLPAAAAGWTVAWPPGIRAQRPVCGYRWPPGEMYHSVYFGSLLVVTFAGHYAIYACFAYLACKRVQRSKGEFPARHDTLQRCRAAAAMVGLNFLAYSVFWAQHAYAMVVLQQGGEGQPAGGPHVPSGSTEPLSLAASAAVYAAAGSNLPVCGCCMDRWRGVARDALRCRWPGGGGGGGGGGVRPANSEEGNLAVAVIDVTAATDDDEAPPVVAGGHSNRGDDDSDSRSNQANLQQSDEEMEVQEVTL